MSNKQQPPLPTLQPGDSHMESLIEAAIQGHADTRDAMRWLVRQLVPATQPAEVTDAMLHNIDNMHNWQTTEGRMGAYRAILALRPERVPMTMRERVEVFERADLRMGREPNLSWRHAIVEETEKHHGIKPKEQA